MPVPKSSLENLPMDILIEILALVNPKDLLTLARTSKTFRAFLMNRKSERCWKAARSTIKDFPPCPPFLSEPQYANLLFTTDCMKCSRPSVGMAIWDFFVRYCKSCLDEMVIHEWTVTPWRGQITKATKLRGARFLKMSDYVSCRQLGFRSGDGWPSSGGFYHLPDFLHFKETWGALPTAEEKTQFIKTLVAEVVERERVTTILYSMGYTLTGLVYSITRRLTNEGWGEEVEKLTPCFEAVLQELFAQKTERLDDQGLSLLHILDTRIDSNHFPGWGAIRTKVIAKIKEFRAARQEEERSRVIGQRLSRLGLAVRSYDESLGLGSAASNLQAEVADLALMPSFRQLVDAPLHDPDVSSEIVGSELLKKLPDLRDQWYRNREKEFQELAQKTAPAQCKDPSLALSLAIVTFRCNVCTTDLRWPDVLAHRCTREDPTKDTYWAAVISFCHTYSMPYPHRGSSIFNVQFVPQLVQDMIRIAGFDPYNVSYKDMQSCGTRWYCKICTVPSVNYAEVHTWQSTAHLQMRCNIPESRAHSSSRDQASKWQVLDDHHAVSVRALETAQRTTGVVFTCSLCQYSSTDYPAAHCLSAHSDRIERRPNFGNDYYLRPSTDTGRPPIKIYPEHARSNAVASKAVAQHRALFSSRFELLSGTGST
ncbi:hypothetical protein BD413DRAFT_476981 [Trametes elegans]|nr:hypothetical protein BD413DRAFT_476981 [Trametes elegans]